MPADLEVEPPDVVRLLVQQGRGAGLEGRVEPEPPFGREVHVHLHVGDEKTVLEHTALETEAKSRPHGRAGAVAGDHPVGGEPVRPVGGQHLQDHAFLGLRNALYPVAAADFHGRAHRLRGADTVDQGLLQIGLLQVDEGWIAVPRLGQQVELEHLAVAVEHLAQVPHHAPVQQLRAAAETVGDLQAALGDADRPAAHADALVVVQHQHRHALQPEIESSTHPHRPAADDHHRVADGRCRILVRGARVGVLPEGERVAILKHRRSPRLRAAPTPAAPPTFSRSRWAVQMRGVSMPRASS